MKQILVLMIFLFFCYVIMFFFANYIGSKEDARKIEIIGNSLYANKILYARFIENPQEQIDILQDLSLGNELKAYQGRIGFFKGEPMYISYYSGYEKSIYYYPEKKCWDNLNGMYRWIGLERCKESS